MANFDQIIDKLNLFLHQHGLEKLAAASDLETLLRGVLCSTGKETDKTKRDKLTWEIVGQLKKYFGGKTLEDAYSKVKREQGEEEVKKPSPADKAPQDPHRVPTFDELFNK